MKTESELAHIVSCNLQKLELLCRLCLNEEINKSFAIFENDTEKMNPISQKIMLCTSVKVEIDDKLPNIICETCYTELNNADQFRIKCETSDTLLRKFLKEVDIKCEGDALPDLGNSDDFKVDKELSEVISVEDIKQETFEFDDAFYEDSGDREYIPEAAVKKKKKRKTCGERKCKNKFRKDFSIDNDVRIKEEVSNIENVNEELHEHLDDEAKSKCKKFVCDICTKPLSSKASLESHIEKMHCEEKKLKMGYITGYGADRRFHCSECEYVCTRRQALDYHMTTHTGLKPFQCDVCMKCFAQHGALNAHKKIHSDKMYFTCQECGKQFKHKEKYVKHRNNVHQNKDVRHYCNICNKGLKTQKTLAEHMNRHMQIKNYSCEFCGKSVVTRVDLVLHLRVHKRDKMFKCVYCDYSTYSKKTLAIHINRHTKARSFQCEHCDYMCYTRGELKFHTRKHTKEQNYSCPLCDTKFRYSSSVNKHMLRKHGEKYKWNDTVDRRTVK